MSVIPYPSNSSPPPPDPGDPAPQPVQVMTLSNQDVLRLITRAGTAGVAGVVGPPHCDKDFIAWGEYSTRMDFKTAGLKLDRLTPVHMWR